MSTVSQYEFKAIPAGQINVDEALGIIECFVAGVGNKDSVGDVVLPGAFTESLKRRKPRVVWGHDWNHPIGKVLEIYEVGASDPRLPVKMRRANIGGLFAKVQFNLKSEKGREAFSQVAFYGEEQEWSIGYKTLDAFFDPSRKANMLKEVELYEVSPVLHGANQLTGTISIKSNEPLKDPDGGLTAAGRRHYNETEGSNLKPGVKGPADTPDKLHRKGSFLTRFFTNPSGPMKDERANQHALRFLREHGVSQCRKIWKMLVNLQPRVAACLMTTSHRRKNPTILKTRLGRIKKIRMMNTLVRAVQMAESLWRTPRWA